MERKGVIRTIGVYYELACYLCNYGRWRNVILEVLFSIFWSKLKSNLEKFGGGHIRS